MQKTPLACFLGVSIILTGTAYGQSTSQADVQMLTDMQFMERVEKSTYTLNAMAENASGGTAKMIFRRLRILHMPSGRRVCGEAKDNVDQVWVRFYSELDDRGPVVEPYVETDFLALEPLSQQCTTAIHKLPAGTKGSAIDIAACTATRLAGEAKLEQARFRLLYAFTCR